MTELLSIILAAGEGTRMRSAIPKVLHPVGGAPLVAHVVRTAQAVGSTLAVVIGPGHDAVQSAVAAVCPTATFGLQAERKGTAHAVRQQQRLSTALKGNVIVLYADATPLVSGATIRNLTSRLESGADIVVVGFRPNEPTGYGRLVTSEGRLTAILSTRTPARRSSPSICAIPASWLSRRCPARGARPHRQQ